MNSRIQHAYTSNPLFIMPNVLQDTHFNATDADCVGALEAEHSVKELSLPSASILDHFAFLVHSKHPNQHTTYALLIFITLNVTRMTCLPSHRFIPNGFKLLETHVLLKTFHAQISVTLKSAYPRISKRLRSSLKILYFMLCPDVQTALPERLITYFGAVRSYVMWAYEGRSTMRMRNTA